MTTAVTSVVPTAMTTTPAPAIIAAPGTTAPSIFQRAMGPSFHRLHPELQRRFGLSSAAGLACIGTGRMERVWHGAKVLRPFLRLGTGRNLLFPETGKDVAFTIANYPYVDRFGRETVTFVRTFQFARPRRFDATMVASARRPEQILDYLGTHQHIAADLNFRVTRPGGLLITSQEQRFTALPGSPRCPSALTGHARVHEWYDDEARCFRINVQVVNPLVGPVIGYSGSFTAEYVPVNGAADVPRYVRPVRECRRG